MCWRKASASRPARHDLAHVRDVEDAGAGAHRHVLRARSPRTAPASPSRRRARGGRPRPGGARTGECGAACRRRAARAGRTLASARQRIVRLAGDSVPARVAHAARSPWPRTRFRARSARRSAGEPFRCSRRPDLTRAPRPPRRAAAAAAALAAQTWRRRSPAARRRRCSAACTPHAPLRRGRCRRAAANGGGSVGRGAGRPARPRCRRPLPARSRGPEVDGRGRRAGLGVVLEARDRCPSRAAQVHPAAGVLAEGDDGGRRRRPAGVSRGRGGRSVQPADSAWQRSA